MCWTSALTLHAEHGGGNNSTFTTHVRHLLRHRHLLLPSRRRWARLKGPTARRRQHQGGATCLTTSKRACAATGRTRTRCAVLSGTAPPTGRPSTSAGLIYGMGHAIYSLSDPRAEICSSSSSGEAVAEKKDMHGRVSSSTPSVERLAPEVISRRAARCTRACRANVDFYSGFVYQMLGIPAGAVHPPVCHRPHRGLERPPAGGAGQLWQPHHPPRLQGHSAPAGVHGNCTEIKYSKLCMVCVRTKKSVSSFSTRSDAFSEGKTRLFFTT